MTCVDMQNVQISSNCSHFFPRSKLIPLADEAGVFLTAVVRLIAPSPVEVGQKDHVMFDPSFVVRLLMRDVPIAVTPRSAVDPDPPALGLFVCRSEPSPTEPVLLQQ
jgi:hypothetical protein